MTRRRTLAITTLVLAVLLSACDSRPRAPALRSSPEFRDDREGLRFAVPDGWIQTAVASLPARLEDEIILVQYKMRTPGQSASVEILCFDEDQPSDLIDYHAGPSHGVVSWTPVGDREELNTQKVPSQRMVYQANTQGKTMVKEVVTFRKQQRVYSFIGLFFEDDDKAREQLRQAIKSILWK